MIKKIISSMLLFITAASFPVLGEDLQKSSGPVRFDLSRNYQPDFEKPRKYTSQEMNAMAQEVLGKIEKRLKTRFNQSNPQHVMELAEFFALTSNPLLDPYSTPMEEGDVHYFSNKEENKGQELFPQDARQLAIRFYWEGLARVGAAYYKLEVVNEKRAAKPVKSRGKVSDMATTAMFDKKPGISTAQAAAQGKERYDVRRLIQHLKVKGLPARKR